MSGALRIIVTGLIGHHPLGGVCWDYIQYPLGLARLGHDVYYFEDSGEWPYSFDRIDDSYEARDCTSSVAYLTSVMESFGLGERWAYRCPIDGTWYGLSNDKRCSVLKSADLLLNVSGTLAHLDTYSRIHTKAYIDSDPGFTQIKLLHRRTGFREAVDFHDVHFTFGEALSTLITQSGHAWRPTRQPIVLDQWHGERSHRNVFTTVMNWASYAEESFEGRTYGQKNTEFMKFLELPRQVAPTTLEIAGRGLHGSLPGMLDPPLSLSAFLTEKGFRVVNNSTVCADFNGYRSYIQSSKAEWSVAKHGYVTGKTGWFSCRSACYLAAGRPVVLQDTGFSCVLPVGEGLVPFTTPDEAADAIKRVDSAYEKHARAAREIAREYFASEKVLDRLIEAALNWSPAEVRI